MHAARSHRLLAACAVTALCGYGTAMAAPFLYSLSYTGGIKIFDTQTQTFVANTIPVPASAVGFALSPSGDRLYISGNNTIDVIDTSNNSAITSITPGCLQDDGERIAVRPQNDKLYFACKTGVNAFSLFPISISGNTYVVQAPILAGITGRPIGIAINNAGTRLWIALQSLDVLPVDLVNNVAGAAIPAVVDPNLFTDIAYDPNLNRVYVPTATGARPIDASNDAALPAIGGASLLSVASSPDGSRVYALAGFPLFGITAFTAGGTLIGPVTGLTTGPLGSRMAIAVSPFDGTIYALGNSGGCDGITPGFFQAIDPVTLIAGTPIQVPGIYCEPRAAGKIILGPFAPAAVPPRIPALSEWVLMMLAAMLTLFGIAAARTRAARWPAR
jgi:hypothetical protein